MKKVSVVILFCVINTITVAQINPERRIEAYQTLLSFVGEAHGIVIDDYYYNTEQRGAIPILMHPDSLILSNVFRDSVQRYREGKITFKRITNYNDIYDDVSSFVISDPESKCKYIYIMAPVPDQGIHNLLFSTQRCTVFIPVISIEKDGVLLNSTSSIYSVSLEKQRKPKVKKLKAVKYF